MLRTVFLMIGIVMAITSSSFADDTKEIAFINAKIYTGTDLSTHNAFLVKHGKFSRLGSSELIMKELSKNGAVVDLKNALVMPGFIESHAHLLGIGQNQLRLDVRGKQMDEIVALVKAQSTKQAPNTWITGRGWDQNLWPQKSYPADTGLNEVKNPVMLRRVDGHAIWVNRAALSLAGVTKETADPKGGQIIRDSKQMPTGILIDNAMSLVSSLIEKPKRADLEQYLALAIKEAHRLGITSLHDAGVDNDTLALYEEYAQQNKLKLRIYAMIDGSNDQLVTSYLKRGPTIGDFLTIRSIKYFADGALGSRGATLLKDYHDKPGHKGLALIEKEALIEKTKAALAKGFQVATHAIGDHANRLVLDAYEAAQKSMNISDARLRIEHAQVIDPADHKRFKQLSVIASMQPTHCTSDMTWVPDRLGNERIKDRAYPWRSLLNHGVIIAFGSDAPVEHLNPIFGLYAAVTRADLNQKPTNGFMPEQKLRLKEALNGFFSAAAFAEFNEDRKGKIAEGYFADFIVFETDLLKPIRIKFLEAKPAMTVINGDIVYRKTTN